MMRSVRPGSVAPAPDCCSSTSTSSRGSTTRLGHGAGDAVLREVASLMRAAVRRGDVVARLGGDEFVVLLEPLDDEAAAVKVADRIVTALSRPIARRGRLPSPDRRQHRGGGRQRGRDRRRRTAPRGGRRALPREGVGTEPSGGVRPQSASRAEPSGHAGAGAGPGDRAGRACASLPADRLRHQHRGARL